MFYFSFKKLFLWLLFFGLSLAQAFAAIDVNKTFSPGTVYPSQNSQLTILFQNSALSPVLNVAATDDFPTNIFVSGTPGLINTCGGIVNFSNTASGGTISLSGGTIPAGDGTNPGTCSIKINTYASKAGSYINTIDVGSVTGEVLGFPDTNTQASQGTLVAIIQDVTVSQSSRLLTATGVASSPQWDEIAYHKFTFSNPNPVNLTQAAFSLTFDPTLIVFSTGASTTCGSGNFSFVWNTVTFSWGTIPPKIAAVNGTCDVNIQVQPARSILLPYARIRPNIIFSIGGLTTLEWGTNAAASSYRYDMQSGVLLDRYYGAAGTSQIQTIDINTTNTTTARVRFTTFNTQTVSNFSFLDNVLPAGMTITGINSNTCGGTASIVGWNQLSLSSATLTGATYNAAGIQSSNCEISYNVQVSGPGTYSTPISAWNIGGYQYDPDASTLTVTGNVFEVSMAFTRGIYQGDTTKIAYTLTNRSSSATISNIDITDLLSDLWVDNGASGDTDPIFKVSHKYSTPTTSCSSGTILAASGATTISLQDFVLAPNTTCAVNVEIIADTDAIGPTPTYTYKVDTNHTNTLPVGSITFDSGSGVQTFATVVSAPVSLSRMVILSKSWTPIKVGSSGISRLRININKRSLDQNGMYNIYLRDPLPAGFSVAPTPNILNGCAGTVTANPGDTNITLSGGYMNPNTGTSVTCSIFVNVKAKSLTPGNTTENHTNTIPGDTHGNPVYFSARDISGKPIENQFNATSAVLTIEEVNLSINTEFLQSNINGGAASRVRTTISNLAPTAVLLTGVSLTDVFPTGVQLYSDVNPIFSDTAGSVIGNCNSASFVAVPGSNSITLSGAQMSPATVCYFEYNVTALVWGNHINTVGIGDVINNEGITNTNSAASTLTVGRQVNVGKGFSPNTIEVGGTSTLTISIYNTQTAGNNETGTDINLWHTQAALRDILPIGMNIISTPMTTCSGGLVSTGSLSGQDYIELNGGLFPAESVCTITATVKINNTGTYTNTIPRNNLYTVFGSQNPDEATANIRVIQKPTISKSFNATAIASGGTSTITFTLTNPNNATLLPAGISGVRFSDTLSNMQIASPLTVGGTCVGVSYNASVGGSNFEVTNGKIPAGGSCTITILVTSSIYGDHPNQTTGLLTSETQTVGTGSNIATLKVMLPPTISKSFSGTTVSTGQPSRLTFTLTNPNNIQINTLNFYDIFPSGMQLAPTPNITETCVGTPVFTDYNTALASAAGNTSIQVTWGSIAASSSCTIAMNVVTTLGGSLVNTSSTLSSTAGVSASGATATLTSLANTPPVITLTWSGTLTIEAGSVYSDAGATALDDQDGNLTASMTSTGSVNTSATGSYTIMYNVTDLGGMSATPVSRTVTVVDTTPPIITLTWSGNLTLEVGSSYTDLGAICSDNLDIPCPTVTSSGTVNISVLGTYTITYNVTDASGNIATQVTRTVNVVDTTPPLITLSGSSVIQIYRGTSYSDAGASCVDNYDASCSVTSSGSVDSSTLGTYTITYTAIDSSGNTRTETRSVQVVSGNTPILSLVGMTPYTHEVLNSYTDSGATANDTEDGNITGNITSSGSVNANVLGSYTITYSVTDSHGNIATPVTRTVNVVDTVKPLITRTGSGNIIVVKGYSYSDSGATASDNYDGDITGNIAQTGSVDTNTLGTYTLRYNVSDSSLNVADEVTRTVQVVSGDTPVLTLTGSWTLTLEVGSSYTDAWATASDTEDGNITGNITSSGSVNTALLGTYTLTYDVTDISGNTATQVTRTVHIVDTTKPVITLQGASSMQVYQNTVWSDPGYSCSDNYDSNCVVTASGSVNMATPGSYTITYSATDSSGNTQVIQRIVEVISGNTPIISLTGSGAMSIEVGSNYTDAGATASDTEDGDITGNIVQTWSVNTNLLWTYIFTYDVTDSHGNQAMQVTRTVNIVDTTKPNITMNGSGSIIIIQGGNYTDAGATCTDNYDTNCNVNSSGSVDTNTVWMYTITYSATDSSGNTQTLTRTVEVLSGIPPAMTLNGNATLTLEVGSPYTELWATAVDQEDGDVTGNITQSGSVNTNVLGTYMITYRVTDSHGNSSNITRTIHVVDTTAPIITNPNISPLKIIVWQTLNLQTVTCRDNYDTNCSVIQSGSVSPNIVGTYTLTYTATDSSGNTTIQTQVVEVQPTHYAGGGTGGGKSKDACPSGDTSGDLYDGKCETPNVASPQEPGNTFVPTDGTQTPEEEKTNETPVETPEETPAVISPENPETILEKETKEGQSYTLKNDFQSCKIIDDILDLDYQYPQDGVFSDEESAEYKDLLLKFAQIGIIDGYEDGSVKPNQKMSRAEFLKVALISHCYTYRELEGKTQYTDTQTGTWQSKVIEKSESLKMVNGYEDGTFQADTEISKAEAVKILMRLSFVYAKTPVDLQYEDVKVNWHQNYVRTGETLWLFDAQADGYMFEPDVWVEREEMVDLIYRLVKLYR